MYRSPTLAPLAFGLMSLEAFRRVELEERSDLSWARFFVSSIGMDGSIIHRFLEKEKKVH